MATGIQITPASGITVGTTPITSGTDNRILYQSGGVVQQSERLTFDGTNFIAASSPYAKFVFTKDVNDAPIAKITTSNNDTAGLYSDYDISSLYTGALRLFNYSGALQTNIKAVGTSYLAHSSSMLSIGASTAGARLDVRAQGALSTDIAFRVRNSADTDNLAYVAGNGIAVIGINSSSSPTLILDPAGSTRAQLRGGTNNSIQLNNSAANLMESGNLGWDIANGTGNCRIRTSMQYAILNQGSFQLNVTGAKTSGTATNSILIENGTAPSTNVTDNFWIYSADQAAGNAVPHFRTENGSIIKIYQETTGVAAATFAANTSGIANDTATFDGYTIGQVVKALRNLGILA